MASPSPNGRRICKEVKLLAVRYYLITPVKNIVHIARYFDCSPRTLRRWIEDHEDEVIHKWKLKKKN